MRLKVITPQPLPITLSVLLQPLCGTGEEVLADNGWYRDADIMIGWCRNLPEGPSGQPTVATGRMKRLLPRHALPATINSLPSVGRVEQHRVDHGPAPVPMTGGARDALAEQAPADPGQRQALVGDPGEDLAHDPGGLLVDLITSSPSANLSRDIAIAEGSAGKDTHSTRLGPVALSTPAALEHLGSLVLGKHTLELQQQTVFRGIPSG